MLNISTLNQMKNIDIRTIDPDMIADSKEINIDISLPVPERMADYITQSGNPYFIKVGKIIVKMGYADTTVTVNDCFERYMKTC